MFCLTRPTAITSRLDDAMLVVGADDQAAEVGVAGAAVDLAAAMIGTSCPSTSPMRRLKYGITSWFSPRPNAKMSSPSRKNVRFSGKNSGNRVRFVRRVSTSVSAKSVLTVQRRDDVRAEALRDVEARLKLAVDVVRSPGMPPPVVTAGRTVSPGPDRTPADPVSSPARLVCVT